MPVSLQILSNSTLDDTLRYSTLTSDELRSYCQRRFTFEQRELKFFPSLRDKWRYIREAQMKRREMNTPADAQIIEIQPLISNDQPVVVSATLKPTSMPVQSSQKMSIKSTSESKNLNNKKVTIDLYPSKSPIALLQEYALKRLKASVRYDWFTTDVSNSPFGCRVLVGDIVYGTGIGRNKRTAKLNATEESLLILLPQYKKLQQQQQQTGIKESTAGEKLMDEEGCIDDDESLSSVNTTTTNNNNGLNGQEQVNSSLLDEYSISDTNIYDVCITLGKPTPYQMLEKSLTYNVLTRTESNIKLTMTKKPMFTHITLEIGSEHKEEAQAKDKAHAKNLGINDSINEESENLEMIYSFFSFFESFRDRRGLGLFRHSHLEYLLKFEDGGLWIFECIMKFYRMEDLLIPKKTKRESEYLFIAIMSLSCKYRMRENQ